ncbi:MAG: RidA family protein [Alcanivoracaceae bacterium]|nr:RidA family protein [Alcanivoracaceae bacterium]
MKKKLNPFPIVGPYAGIYSHGIEINKNEKTVYVSGQVGQDENGKIASGFEGQCKQALMNVLGVLKEAQLEFQNIVKMNIYLTRPEDMQALVDIRLKYLDGVGPAITTVIVSALVNSDWLVEIDVIATS